MEVAVDMRIYVRRLGMNLGVFNLRDKIEKTSVKSLRDMIFSSASRVKKRVRSEKYRKSCKFCRTSLFHSNILL